ncbi:hypothetical protein [Veronia pacifica]|uniref:Uncharacterized protein n=1 Tax=Veronia pacifica TaxID=1080227 RepID=A0A1C3EE01_9GAMM|nr:hypothetical protein [Veronia pacifica]ODA31482.1 hypothetical protein A8L45_17000 [Veronia pacifica]
MSWKDFFFWLVTWLLTIASTAIIAASIAVASERLFSGLIEEVFMYAAIPLSILSAVFIQPRLKKMFGYQTGLDK